MFQFKPIDQSPILNFVKSKKKSITSLSLASLSAVSVGFIQNKANAIGNPGVFGCGNGVAVSGQCFYIVGASWTWFQSIADQDCRNRFGNQAIASRTYLPYYFVCGLPSGRQA
jgi:hypothetical protein